MLSNAAANTAAAAAAAATAASWIRLSIFFLPLPNLDRSTCLPVHPPASPQTWSARPPSATSASATPLPAATTSSESGREVVAAATAGSGLMQCFVSCSELVPRDCLPTRCALPADLLCPACRPAVLCLPTCRPAALLTRRNEHDQPADSDGHWGLVYCECRLRGGSSAGALAAGSWAGMVFQLGGCCPKSRGRS